MIKEFLKISVFCAAILSVGAAFGVRHVGFQTDAFNRAFPASYAESIVFSPGAFEIDCAIIAESLETIPKAKVSERMGVLLSFENTYGPIVEYFASVSNGVSLVSARGFCVNEPRKAPSAHRQFLQRVYRTEVMQAYPEFGAQSWFRTTMDGRMEDFALPNRKMPIGKYSYYDLLSINFGWAEPFPTDNTRKVVFHRQPNDQGEPVECLSDVRVAEGWIGPFYTLLKLPMKDGAWFYAMMPHEDRTLEDIRRDLLSTSIDRVLTITKSVTEKGVFNGPCAIVLPKIKIVSRVDFMKILGAAEFSVPTTDLKLIAGSEARECVQVISYVLNEQGPGEKPLKAKDEDEVVAINETTPKLIFNRPFIFFVYHEKTGTVPVAGQFCGGNQ